MSTIGSRWQVAGVAAVLTTSLTAYPVHAQTSQGVGARNLTPLAASVEAVAVENSRLLTQTTPAPTKRRSCGKSAAIGLAIGAGAGLAVGAGLLASTGGSDAAYRILFTFTGVGAGIGGLLGTSSCSK
jgi:hypothetical protein